jgi:hypothetical protein
MDLDPSPAGAHLGLGFVLTATGNREAAVDRLHEVRAAKSCRFRLIPTTRQALIRSPGDPVSAEIMNVCLDSRLTHLKAVSKDSAYFFPGLSPQIGRELDADVAREEATYLSVLHGSAGPGEGDDSSMQVVEETQDPSQSVDMDETQG